MGNQLKPKFWCKGKFKATDTHFINKIVSHRTTIIDGLDSHFRSFITIFIPKLTPKHRKPRLMLHITNGGGTCLVRVKDPNTLIENLQDIIDTLKSDKWLDTWWRAESISEQIVDNQEVILEEEIVDINEWKEWAINNPEIQVEIK